MGDTVIKVDGVYKDFVLPHERAGSVKGVFTSMFSKATSKKENQNALKDISFEIKKGEFFGIVGRNGSGKSTLLKILAGIYQPTKGEIKTYGKLVPFIELGVGFNPELTGRDNVYLNGAMLGFSVKEIEAIYDEIVSFAELDRFMDQKLKNYSSGMQVRLAFSLAIRAKAEILLFDEVLAVGDADFQRKCFNHFRQLKKQKKTVVFVSHDMNAIREYCDRVVLIDKSQIIKIGTANSVSQRYSRLFIENAGNDGSSDGIDKDVKRWGTGDIRFTKIRVVTETKPDCPISVICEAEAKTDIEEALFGFLIKNSADVNLLGTNTQIKNKKITNLKKGSKIKVTWVIPNIFSDGVYVVVPTAVLYDGQICDWWDDAAEFTIRQEDRAPYVVAPNIDVELVVDK